MQEGSSIRIYLDFNASTPVAPEVAARMQAVLNEPFGNPSSDHWAGQPAREAVEKARAQVACLLGCEAGEVVFTSGGSEANNHALKGIFFARPNAHPHIITTQVEHPAIVNPCRFLERLGAQVTYLPVDTFGRVDPDDLRRAVTRDTILISVMHANNEVGTIQPMAEIGRIARQYRDRGTRRRGDGEGHAATCRREGAADSRGCDRSGRDPRAGSDGPSRTSPTPRTAGRH